MLHDQGLPFFLWVEACKTAVYLQNRCPHRALGRKTLEEAFTRRRPSLGGGQMLDTFAYLGV